MARRKTSTESSLFETFWAIIEDNPKLAISLAFELGFLAGGAVRNSKEATKYFKKQSKRVPQALSDIVPRSLPAVLKFFPAPKLQPHKRPQAKRSSKKAKQAA